MDNFDLIIEELIIEDDRPTHIAKHDVTIGEVTEVIESNYIFIQGKFDRWILIGKTNKKRFLSIVVGKREKKNPYGLITARPAHKTERSLYKEYINQKGGE